MTKLIQTASGSTYALRDTVAGHELRRVNPDNPKRLDDTFIPVELHRDPTVGLRMILTLRPDGQHPIVRSTTPVTHIEDLAEPPC